MVTQPLSAGRSSDLPPLDECPFAVVDLETTGFDARRDAIVEVSVVHVDPGGIARVAFDSILDPRRPLAGTHVHGIGPQDVIGAPTFGEAAGDLARALAGRVLVGHNFAFDQLFLERAFLTADIELEVPYICTMYLRPLLGLGRRVSLDEACGEAGIVRRPAHAAGADALDTAALFGWQLAYLRRARVRTFADLARRGDYTFVRSFAHAPLPVDVARSLPECEPRSRGSAPGAASHRHRVYFEALAASLMDLQITPTEAAQMIALRRKLGLTLDDVRGMHAQAFAGALLTFTSDQRIDDTEAGYLRDLGDQLSGLDWAPRD